ncbi:MAG: hypothetical protein GF308_14155 [Candidatus Heimdallarchaeota archaeon]|nr:hypothetical protein [Candidatus Heimdallarchaeota archaeon]
MPAQRTHQENEQQDGSRRSVRIPPSRWSPLTWVTGGGFFLTVGYFLSSSSSSFSSFSSFSLFHERIIPSWFGCLVRAFSRYR